MTTKQAVREQKLSFYPEMNKPNMETLKAMAEVEYMIEHPERTGKTYETAEELMEETVQQRRQFNVEGKSLVKAVPKRYKIVQKFNKKYNLYLTDDQIKTIVDASYVSVLWEAEIIAMDKEYNSVYEWLNADTAWLRAYLLAFNVQDVSSDFAQQREIAFQAFDQIFRETDFKAFPQRKYLLSNINARYLTNFDDVTFMTAYRFLQSEGRDYDIGNGTILRNEDKVDVLARKYS